MAPRVRPSSPPPGSAGRPAARLAASTAPRGAIGQAPPVPGAAMPAPERWSLYRTLCLWIWRAQSRRALAELDADRLRDIGVHPRVARREAEKPFWRA
ncbi:DUF1127 domain-containing protein [Azorhizobium doebereinerae]|uniref:DUF1127 domain-containing protein n=1 Tax=Azorhizobium doebereinerae TaxID=281091 RepID=UPI00040BA0AB|nr:DUF1127 domain-containing protein [Azorhizobium doebereinerae]